MPIADAFRKHWRQILLVAGSYLSQGVFAYICVAYLVAYGTSVAKIDRTWALFGVFVAAVVAVVMYPVFGSLSDRVGRKALFLIGVVLMAVTIGPVFAMINTGSPCCSSSLWCWCSASRWHPRPVSIHLSQVVGSAFAPTIAAALYGATRRAIRSWPI
jgi:MFS family permease